MIEESPQWQRDEQEMELNPRPLPGKLEECTYNEKDMLYWDYKYNLYAKDRNDDSKFIHVVVKTMGSITALPGMTKYFEDESSDEEHADAFDDTSFMCVINGKEFGAKHRGNGHFDLYRWSGVDVDLESIKSVGKLLQHDEETRGNEAGFFDVTTTKTKRIVETVKIDLLSESSSSSSSDEEESTSEKSERNFNQSYYTTLRRG